MKFKKRFVGVGIGIVFLLSIMITQIPGIPSANALETKLLAQEKETEKTEFVGEIVNCRRYVKVYVSPSKKSETMWRADKGDKYIVNTSYYSRRWYQISHNNMTGYVRKNYVSLSEVPVEIAYDMAGATEIPVKTPTETPAETPAVTPTDAPAESPTATPTEAPVESPTASPTDAPAGSPTASQTDAPAGSPTASPTETPAESPTASPTETPAETPAPSPTEAPAETTTPSPTESPAPSATTAPTPEPPAEDSGSIDPDSWYTIDNAQFSIDSTGSNARSTTDGINDALAWAKEQGYKKIKFTDGTYLIQCTWNNRYIAPTDGILVPSGLTLDLGNSTFRMEDNSYPAYCIFGIVDQRDITILGGTLIGDLDNHVYASVSGSESHEWGFGICVSASSNILIQDVTIRKMTGDGIILEGSYDSIANGGRVSSNVKIKNCDISNCRRQGVSVVGSTDSEVAGNKIYNISGTDPQYGIDVEPEFDYPVAGLKIHGNTIYGCSGGAITCCKGGDYEVYNNTVTDTNIIAVFSSNVRIYGNTLNKSFIRVMPEATDVTVDDNILDDDSWVFFG